MPHYNLYPLLKLLSHEDPLEIARYLDDLLSFMVELNEYEGRIEGLGHRYQLIRTLRDAFIATTKDCLHGDH
ncbi:MAG: hypothetical protein AAF620_19005 [Bacteroidota bacterium]